MCNALFCMRSFRWNGTASDVTEVISLVASFGQLVIDGRISHFQIDRKLLLGLNLVADDKKLIYGLSHFNQLYTIKMKPK